MKFILLRNTNDKIDAIMLQKFDKTVVITKFTDLCTVLRLKPLKTLEISLLRSYVTLRSFVSFDIMCYILSL